MGTDCLIDITAIQCLGVRVQEKWEVEVSMNFNDIFHFGCVV